MGGRGSARGVLQGRTDAQDKAIRKIAKQTRNLKKEQYRIVDDNGDIVLAKRGTQHEVAATVGEKRDYLKGNISIHNHPEGGTFSADDISEFGYGAREIVAASPEGTYRLINAKYGTKQAYDGWVKLRDGAQAIPERSAIALRRQAQENTANSASARQLRDIEARFNDIRTRDGREAAQRYYDSVKEKYDEATSRHREEINAEVRRLETQPFHDYYKKNAAKYGFVYRFEKGR